MNRLIDGKTHSEFFLKKWYLDAMNEEGSLYIGYWLQAGWKQLSVVMYQQLFYSPASGKWSQTRVANLPPPAWEQNGVLRWTPPDSTATWHSSVAPLRKTLVDNARGRIEWHCCQPKAKVNVEAPNFEMAGWGYSEVLELTIPVWRLPFKRLYWGRCHSKSHYLVWIVWDGESPGKFLWVNGQRYSDWTLVNCLPAYQGMQIEIEKPYTLRQGNLISTIFGSFSQVTSLFPKATFLAEEHKWCANGRLHTTNGSEPATIIYEKVQW